ncbi:hypothetical protein D9757_007493 [Collybiopsis confluens]|uniref:F-box domain-containing protein n=1 Tax=Collybiopsis confluens TaxID=2823264 RepID=A0A8H5HJR3_9AGAR|nr:hypothetical protein D9757_007493 [Collybiopsis confluens]
MSSSLVWNMADSPFSLRLGTNYAPSSEELFELDRILVEPQQVLDRLDSEIARVQPIFDRSLLSQKQQVESYIDAHRALMAPFARFPPKPSPKYSPGVCHSITTVPELLGVAHAPLLLTTVSQHWRCLALNTPRLWSSLRIQLLPDFPESLQSQRVAEDVRSRRIAVMERWLRRSGVLPITISLYSNVSSSSPFGVSNFKTMAQMMRSLLGFEDRVQNLSFMYTLVGDLDVLREMLPSGSSLPSLLSFKLEKYRTGVIRGRLDEAWILSDQISPLLSRMPALKNLKIPQQIERGNISFHMLHCRWDMLTNLSLLPLLAPNELFIILTKSPTLKELSVGISLKMDLFDASASSSITLTHLVSLKLVMQVMYPRTHFNFRLGQQEQHRLKEREQDHCVACISAIISRVICPTLISLHVSLHGLRESMSGVPIPKFPLHALETLGLDIPLTPYGFTSCLSRFPNLISLDFVDAGNIPRTLGAISTRIPNSSTLQDTHLAHLTPSTDNPSLYCRRLRNLYVVDHSTGFYRSPQCNWSPRALVKLITARAIANTLDCVDLSFTREPSDEAIQSLRAVDDGGGMRLFESTLPPPPSQKPGGESRTGGRRFRYVRWSG